MTEQTHARLYDTYSAATDAVHALEAAGFSSDHISVISRNHEEGAHPNMDETAAGTGATVGTLVGGGAGLLAGIGMLAIPGIGPLVAAGWMVAALTGAGAGAAAGGLLGSLVRSGVDEEDAHVYAEGLSRGGTLVTVRADSTRIARAQEIMDAHGPVDSAARAGEYRAGGWSGYNEGSVVIPPVTSNPPGTAASRALDDVAGTNVSGARPGNDAYNPPGTAATRALDDVAGTNVSGARPGNEAHNPPGTAASRAFDDAAGTNTSGARPQNSDGTPNNPPGTMASRGLDKVAGTNVSGAHPENEVARR